MIHSIVNIGPPLMRICSYISYNIYISILQIQIYIFVIDHLYTYIHAAHSKQIHKKKSTLNMRFALSFPHLYKTRTIVYHS